MATPSPTSTLEIERLRESRSKYAAQTHAALTLKGYDYDWRMFETWCAGLGLSAFPCLPETLSLYVTSLLDQGKKITTAQRRTCAVSHRHVTRGLADPYTQEVRAVISGAKRLLLEKPRQMRPFTCEMMRRLCLMLIEMGGETAARDRALMLLGLTTGLRRSNLADLTVEDVEFVDEGLIVSVAREKQDQEGKGRLIGVPFGKYEETCAVKALRKWIETRGPDEGPLFIRLTPARRGHPMDGQSIHRVVQARVKMLANIPADRWGAHSLRAGLVTAGAEAGVSDLIIGAQSGHRSSEMIRRYYRRSELFRTNVCYSLDL
jgi:integrase